MEALGVPPVYPLEGGDLDVKDVGPPAGVDDLVLV